MSAKPEFIEQVKNGNILARQCTKCSELHLATVYFCKKCGNKDFEDHIIAGKGKIVTYTIMTVPPEGFEEFAPYAWAVLELDDDSTNVTEAEKALSSLVNAEDECNNI